MNKNWLENTIKANKYFFGSVNIAAIYVNRDSPCMRRCPTDPPSGGLRTRWEPDRWCGLAAADTGQPFLVGMTVGIGTTFILC